MVYIIDADTSAYLRLYFW